MSCQVRFGLLPPLGFCSRFARANQAPDSLMQMGRVAFRALLLTSITFRGNPGSSFLLYWRLCAMSAGVGHGVPRTQKILDDARKFLGRKKWYFERGIPYRRGYLLEGLPGTGKTSLIRAIAGELMLPLYVINLTQDGLSDSALRTLMRSTLGQSRKNGQISGMQGNRRDPTILFVGRQFLCHTYSRDVLDDLQLSSVPLRNTPIALHFTGARQYSRNQKTILPPKFLSPGSTQERAIIVMEDIDTAFSEQGGIKSTGAGDEKGNGMRGRGRDRVVPSLGALPANNARRYYY